MALCHEDESWREGRQGGALVPPPLLSCPGLYVTLSGLGAELEVQITMFKFHREVDKFAWPFKARKFDSVRDGAAADGAAAAAASAPVDAAGTSPPAPGAAAPAAPPGSVVSSDKIRWMKQQREHKRKMNDAMSTALEKVTSENLFLRVMLFHRANLSRVVAHPFHCASRAGVCVASRVSDSFLTLPVCVAAWGR